MNAPRQSSFRSYFIKWCSIQKFGCHSIVCPLQEFLLPAFLRLYILQFVRAHLICRLKLFKLLHYCMLTYMIPCSCIKIQLYTWNCLFCICVTGVFYFSCFNLYWSEVLALLVFTKLSNLFQTDTTWCAKRPNRKNEQSL